MLQRCSQRKRKDYQKRRKGYQICRKGMKNTVFTEVLHHCKSRKIEIG